MVSLVKTCDPCSLDFSPILDSDRIHSHTHYCIILFFFDLQNDGIQKLEA